MKFVEYYQFVILSNSSEESRTDALNVGIVFCGRQSSGGHNVITGVFDYLHKMNPNSKLYGFIGGTSGLFEGSSVELTEEKLKLYRNMGGYDLLGRSADKISEEDYSKVVATCTKLNLHGLVLIGGAYTATDATLLTEFFLNSGVTTRIVVVPCDYSRDLKNHFIETTVGFDTFCRTVSQLIGNICTDSRSAAKYYHFIRLLGRSPSHVVLESALQSHPNYAVISEEVAATRMTLLQVVNKIADMICQRAEKGLNYGVVLIPEGLIKAISEFYYLLDEISTYVNKGMKHEEIYAKLTPWSKALFDFLPAVIQKQIFNPPESRGSFQLHAISTEVMIGDLVKKELQRRKEEGSYNGHFDYQTHFLGYQARTSFPSLFDCDYVYALGREAAALIQYNLTGYMVMLRNLKEEPSEWIPYALPLLAFCTVEAKAFHWMVTVSPASVWSRAFFTRLPTASSIQTRSQTSVTSSAPASSSVLPSCLARQENCRRTASISPATGSSAFSSGVVPASSLAIFRRFCTRLSIRSSSCSERSARSRRTGWSPASCWSSPL